MRRFYTFYLMLLSFMRDLSRSLGVVSARRLRAWQMEILERGYVRERKGVEGQKRRIGRIALLTFFFMDHSCIFPFLTFFFLFSSFSFLKLPPTSFPNQEKWVSHRTQKTLSVPVWSCVVLSLSSFFFSELDHRHYRDADRSLLFIPSSSFWFLEIEG